jgi:signal transduction histidine kinase
LLSGGLTLAVLCVFAVLIGQVTANRIRSDRDREMQRTFEQLGAQEFPIDARGGRATIDPAILKTYARTAGSVLRILRIDGSLFAETPGAPDFTRLGLKPGSSGEVGGYKVISRRTTLSATGSPYSIPVFIQYARETAPTDATIGRLRLFLLLGVIAGTGLALMLAYGLLGRALAPITRLTRTARDVELTADPSRRVPVPDTADEVAELVRTLDRMLQRLETERAAREEVLDRQREFVADASHELRTPLTSVLANLELLEEVLDGDQQEAAESALRSTQRMRRLVSDLLILARADARQQPQDRAVDLSQIALDVAAELEPVLGNHLLRLNTEAVLIDGVRDQLHRMVSNLVANAIEHTPDGSTIEVRTREGDGTAVLEVADGGPGIPAELRDRIFDRFVRGTGDRGGSTGLGLAIVQAIARSHGGDVEVVCPDGGGTIFTVTLPQSSATGEHDIPEVETGDPEAKGLLRRYTSTTTGSTMGRRRSRS